MPTGATSPDAVDRGRSRGWDAFGFVFLTIALGLQFWAATAQSLSGDGAYHLLAGHQALRYGQNTMNFEHPPLVKLAVAAPLLLEDEPLALPLRVEAAIEASGRIYDDPDRLHRVTLRSRALVIIFFVLPLGIGCWLLGRRFDGPRGGTLLVLLLGLSFSTVPVLSSLQTDAAVTAATVWLLVAACRYLDRPDWRGAVLMGLALGLAMASKFSGSLLVPTVVATVLLAPNLRDRWRARAGELALVAIAALAMLYLVLAAANWRYDRTLGREIIGDFCADGGTLFVSDRLRSFEPLLLAVERVNPPLAQWTAGFLGVRAQNAEGAYLSYAFGSVTRWGRWWYFPVLLLVKMPLAILATALVMIGVVLRRGRPPTPVPSRGAILVGLTVVTYLITAMSSNYNLGYRHLLPVMPLILLPAVRVLVNRPVAARIVVVLLAVESLAVAPHWLSATNTWWLGGANPTRFALGTGNTEYRQNFIALARAAHQRGIEDLGVLYPVLPPEVLAAYLPSARLVGPGDELRAGWYVVNVITEQLVPSVLVAPPEDLPQPGLKAIAADWRGPWDAVQSGEDHGYIAGTFHLYRLPAAPRDSLDR